MLASLSTVILSLSILVNGLASLGKRQVGPSATASSSDGQLKLQPGIAPVQGPGNPGSSSTWQLAVDDTPSGHKQQVAGFGAAVTDATVAVFNALSVEQRAAAIHDLFSADGLSFSLMRHTIASSDLSAGVYTYDDTPDDRSLGAFNLGDNGNAIVSLIRDIKGVQRALTLLGSVWSVPGWMKLNGVTSGTTVNNNLNHDLVGAWAQYFVKYIQAFSDAGATVDAVTIQNEPLNSQNGYPTMYVFAEEAASLIRDNLKPALADAGLSTEIWAYDHNTDQATYPQTVLDNAGSSVSAVAWHCYAPNNNWAVLTDFHIRNPAAKQYMTECWTSPNTGWSQTADFTMGPLQNWASGSIGWTLGSDQGYGPHLSGGCDTCRGIVVVDTNAGTYSKTVDFYMMGQFSKFMPKGATVLATTGSYDFGGGQRIEATASLNPDGSRTVVILNGFSNEVYVTVTMQSGQTWSGSLYAQSVTTWVLPG